MVNDLTESIEENLEDSVDDEEVEDTKELEELSKEDKVVNDETDIANLPGVGEKTGQKLKAAGYVDMMALAAASPLELTEAAALGEATAAKIIQGARSKLTLGYETAAVVMERRKNIKRISTGSAQLDDLLGGGVETQAVTEMHGAFGSGKSQVGFQLAVNVQKPVDEGGLGGGCLFIDTEDTFRPERIIQLAEANGMDPQKVLENIVVARAYNSDHQTILADKSPEVIKKNNIKLIVVDSLMAMFRSDFVGRGTLSSRQQKLNRHLKKLKRLSDIYNVAVYITNQVMSNPAILFGDPTRPIGGHILGHFSTFRVYLRKSKGENRIARMVDSPNLPEKDCLFRVCPEGVRDVE
ncbi:MAG: DNA repair and recombination protein RadA [Candidatus Aenigmarchaeota archaeon]|nr:DNA repair and recombination protein RadA [Candidatus Aenigmarchaeota archaeon]